MKKTIELMDTTLRDGEQMGDISFSSGEKLAITKQLLESLQVSRIEIASARVSQGEFDAVKRICEWAQNKGCIEQVEVLGFVDKTASVDWIEKTGGCVLNLLAKGSLHHLSKQLRKTLPEHIAGIAETVEYAQKKGITVNVYLEDWSNGMKNSPDYVFMLVEALGKLPLKRIMLPDTLGILSPTMARDFCSQMRVHFPSFHFDFHAHNDYGLAVANSLAAVEAGMDGVHATVNGLGERAGNTPLSSLCAGLQDMIDVSLAINEKELYAASKLVETFSGKRIPFNMPVIGENVFVQAAGIHADGDKKANLYANALVPERFGRTREYALGKTSGKANIEKNLEQLGIELLPDELHLVTQRIIELGDKKKNITQSDLPYIIADVLDRQQTQEERVKVINFSMSFANGLRPMATVRLRIGEEEYEETASGIGQYDAFMRSVRYIYKRFEKKLPDLVDYIVTIPPGGKTNALVETTIRWSVGGKEFQTKGFEPDQTYSAIRATITMLNLLEQEEFSSSTVES